MANGYDTVYADKFSDGFRASKYQLIDFFGQRPHFQQFGTQASPVSVPTLPTAAQGNVLDMHFPNAVGNRLIQMFSTTQQTLVPTLHATKGLEIGLDEVNNEAVEYVPGGNHAKNPLGYLAGTDPGVGMRAILEFADISGSDQFLVGWRKQEDYTVPTSLLTTGDANYTDFIGVGLSGSLGVIKTMSDLNNAGSTTVTSTGFTIADGGIIKLEVHLVRRASRVFINGIPTGLRVDFDGVGTDITNQATTTAPVFTVDTGDFMIPWIFSRYDATAPGAIYLRKLEVFQLLEVGLQRENRKPS